MDDECSEAIAEGLSRNSTLRHLDISSNRIGGPSLKRWQEVIGKCNLRYFDISNNPLYDEGAQCLIRGLMEGPLVTEEMVKQQPNLGPVWSRLPPKLKYVYMKNVNMGDETGVLITQLISTNKRLLKLQIDNNTINFKYIEEINAACARNRQQDRDQTIPKYIKELGKLIRSTQNDYGLSTADPQKVKTHLFQQRSHCTEELHYLNYQHTKKAQEVFVKEEFIAGVIQEQTYIRDLLVQEKEQGEDKL